MPQAAPSVTKRTAADCMQTIKRVLHRRRRGKNNRVVCGIHGTLRARNHERVHAELAEDKPSTGRPTRSTIRPDQSVPTDIDMTDDIPPGAFDAPSGIMNVAATDEGGVRGSAAVATKEEIAEQEAKDAPSCAS